LDADSTRGGVLTAWDGHVLSITDIDSRRYTLTVSLTSNTSDKNFTLTNVYALADHVDTPSFFRELIDLADQIQAPGLC
jgi:hypothetical protein